MAKAKNTLPVYDICTLSGAGHLQEDVIVERFADYLKVHPNLHHAHGHSFYHLVLFTKGSGYHTIDFNHFPVNKGEIYFMAPGQVHSWSFEGDVDGYVVNFSDSFFQSFLKDHQYLEHFTFFSADTRDQVLMLDAAELKQASSVLEHTLLELEHREASYLDAVRLHLLLLFLLVARKDIGQTRLQDKSQPGTLVLQSFRRLLNKYYHQYKLPKEYAAMLYVTPNYLNALCNDLLGKSAGEVIRDRILLEARRQLVNLDESIAGIGYNLGFKDNSYFSKFFKKYTGTTPEEFRRELQAPPSKN